jgi:hypothetical protein
MQIFGTERGLAVAKWKKMFEPTKQLQKVPQSMNGLPENLSFI